MADTNFTYLAGIWKLPEAEKLEAQTLDKLALSPWRQITDVTRWLRVTNYSTLVQEHPQARMLRDLLQDALEEESRFEVAGSGSNAVECALAVRLGAERAAVWQTNVAAIRQALPNSNIQMSQSKDWTIVGWSETQTNRAYAAMPQKLESSPALSTTNLAALAFDLQRVVGPLLAGTQLGTNLPLVALTISGDGEYLRTRGTAEFKSGVPVEPEPWLVPTNLIREPLISFTALQGFRPLLEGNKWINYYLLDPPPNQLISWSLRYSPTHIYAAFPRPGASFWLETSGPDVPQKSLVWLTNYARGLIDYSKEHNGLSWQPMPMFTPVLESKRDAGNEYFLARLGATLPPIGSNASPALLAKVTERTNVVYYDWEFTGEKVTQWFLLAQSVRLVFMRAQIPMDSASTAFLVAAAPKLGNTVTDITVLGNETLAMARGSHLGLTAMELHLLGDWLESPDFPRGMFTTLAPVLPRGPQRPPGK